MDKDFCPGCEHKSDLPLCALYHIPDNAYLEDIINEKALKYMDFLVCHNNAQELQSNRLLKMNSCDECGLCAIACPNYHISIEELKIEKLELAIFGNYERSGIFFKSLFPSYIIATGVQVYGNFRTKRVDLVIKKNSSIYLIKCLKGINKIQYYSRSYNDVVNNYKSVFPNYDFIPLFLLPHDLEVSNDKSGVIDLLALSALLGGES